MPANERPISERYTELGQPLGGKIDHCPRAPRARLAPLNHLRHLRGGGGTGPAISKTTKIASPPPPPQWCKLTKISKIAVKHDRFSTAGTMHNNNNNYYYYYYYRSSSGSSPRPPRPHSMRGLTVGIVQTLQSQLLHPVRTSLQNPKPGALSLAASAFVLEQVHFQVCP